MSDIKFCVDCVHYHRRPPEVSAQVHFCHNPEFISHDKVTGVIIAPTCKEMRLLGEQCGPKGLLFEPIPQEPQKKWWEFWK